MAATTTEAPPINLEGELIISDKDELLGSRDGYTWIHLRKDYVVKQMLMSNQDDRSNGMIELIQNEMMILANYYHPHLIKLSKAEVFVTDQVKYRRRKGRLDDDPSWLTCQMYLPRGEPFESTGDIEKDKLLITELISILSALQEAEFFYPDIKVCNVVLIDNHVQLIDFGVLCKNDGREDLQLGTDGDLSNQYKFGKKRIFCSERIKQEIESSDENSRTFFSLGLTIIEFLTGKFSHRQNWSHYIDMTFFPVEYLKRYHFPEEINNLLLKLFGPAKQRVRRFRDLPKLVPDFEFVPLRKYSVTPIKKTRTDFFDKTKFEDYPSVIESTRCLIKG